MNIRIICFMLCFQFGLKAQDFNFSQIAQTPLFINPGCTGVYDGWERIILNHRNQWLGANTQFMTTAIAGDMNFFKSERNNTAHIGVGVLFFNDVGGDAKFGTQAGMLSLSGILPLGYGHTLSLGLQGGVGSRKADISKLSFENQWNGSIYDPTILSGEANTLNSFSYLDAATGLYYEYSAGNASFARNHDFKFQLGASIQHANRPHLKYMNGSTQRLSQKMVFHTSLVADLMDSPFSIDANAVQFIQGGHYQTILGTMLRYRMRTGTKITGNRQNSFFGFGLYTRINDAIIPAILIDYNGFKFGLSYDVTISSMRSVYKGGSLEFSMSFTNLNHALYKQRRGRR
jgi:type IX secretion system PorP/SprF family membrane protein